MLRIAIAAWIDTIKDGREVLRKDVELYNESGILVAKINVPTAERLAHAMVNGEETTAELGARLQAKLAEAAQAEANATGGAGVKARKAKVERKILFRVDAD